MKILLNPSVLPPAPMLQTASAFFGLPLQNLMLYWQGSTIRNLQGVARLKLPVPETVAHCSDSISRTLMPWWQDPWDGNSPCVAALLSQRLEGALHPSGAPPHMPTLC
eukprot:gnl/MRDRNA2_/MRDRNA2_351277_c0_seq1.p1 gnl/MRDRNA2_/MRDRNA2_351277_c0~~gnl/MRDRNA2_/MRDRNA2_351277_c0_seq1.p1  ORF type:complete len:108 (-),score=11.05 gnl/MRDRNA2_/MRDRNA2_351277_c0_seq1:115-438(-)